MLPTGCRRGNEMLSEETIYKIKRENLKKGEFRTKYRISKRIAKAQEKATKHEMIDEGWKSPEEIEREALERRRRILDLVDTCNDRI